MNNPRDFRRVLITGIAGSGGSYLAEYIVGEHPGVELHGIARWHSTTSSDNLSSIRGKVTVGSNPWEATTLEWAATTSPPLHHGNFEVLPIVRRGPYEYNSPEATGTDYLPQNAVVEQPAPVLAPPTAPVVA